MLRSSCRNVQSLTSGAGNPNEWVTMAFDADGLKDVLCVWLCPVAADALSGSR
jgi:hypothetical protein